MRELKGTEAEVPTRRACVWDTREQHASEAFGFYNDAICEAFGHLRASHSRQTRGQFRARVSLDAMDDIWINRVVSAPHRVSRTVREIQNMGDEWAHLNVYRRGGCVIAQDGGGVLLRVGEIALFDGARPFMIDHGDTSDFEVVSFMIPRRRIEARIGGRKVDARRLSRAPFAQLARDTALALADNLHRLSRADAAALFDGLLAFVALDYGVEESAEDAAALRGRPRFLDIKTRIERRFLDPRFDLSRCAGEAGLSTRYVQKLFELYGEGATFGEAVTERRLVWAAGRLRDPARAGDSITSIAFEAGFGDLTNFYRRFRRRFDCSPGDWRFDRA